jgi:hypothetical protein
MTGETTSALQWGALITLPSGASTCEPSTSQTSADNAVRAHNGARPGSAHLVYREVTFGPWRSEGPGDEYAVRYDWPDGTFTVEPSPNRVSAENTIQVEHHQLRRGRNPGDRLASLASRTVTHGQWWLAAAEVAR